MSGAGGTMYAILKTGGKQLKAQKGEILITEKLEGEPGTEIIFDEVLLVVDGDKQKHGAPFVKGAKVTGKILRQAKAAKIDAFNYKPKKNERKRWGHRQPLTHVQVVSVEGGA
jgi:large subunit ribosomal protein L21